jgi:hypothetical protein
MISFVKGFVYTLVVIILLLGVLANMVEASPLLIS